ncbi:MAG TPA: hypothetical protein VKW76_01320 [Candidatus Binatia bacterium]|nr:hypothetical protein [Candidatus Binatia bacterium]
MRRAIALAAALAGCFAASRYAVVRPGLGCDRATRVAYRAMLELGYRVTELLPPQVDRPGVVRGEKTGADGRTHVGEVRIACSGAGAELQPIEDTLLSDFEFSRGFDYSFTNLLQLPDVSAPTAAGGLQVQVRALDPFQARLDLGGVPTQGGAVPMRVVVRNDTDRAVTIDPADVDVVAADGTSAAPLAGAALDAALAPGAAGDRVRAELLVKRRVGPHTTVSGFLVFSPGAYREARLSLTDVETDETEGFVTPIQ